MFKGKVKMIIERLDSYDEYGQPLLSFVATTFCSVVKLETNNEKTPIRATESASHSNANELTSDSVLLINPNAKVKTGDKLTVLGIELKLDKLNLKHDASGKLDHLQVGCSKWQ